MMAKPPLHLLSFPKRSYRRDAPLTPPRTVARHNNHRRRSSGRLESEHEPLRLHRLILARYLCEHANQCLRLPYALPSNPPICT